MESNKSANARRHQLYVPDDSYPRSGSCFFRSALVQPLMGCVGPELAAKFQVDVPFLLQQAQFLYEKQLQDLQLQMQRVNSSTSVLGLSKGIYASQIMLINRLRRFISCERTA